MTTESKPELTSIQRQRIELILDEELPSSYDSQREASIWEQWSIRFNVVFIQYDLDESLSVIRSDSGAPLSNGELNKALTSITEALSKAKSSVPHVRSSDKIKSITTTVNNPKPSAFDKYMKQLDQKLPLSTLKALYNKASQEIESELSGDAEAQLAHVHYLRFRADRAQEIYDANFRKVERNVRIKIDTIRTDSKTRRRVPRPELPKAEKKFIEKNLSPIQVMMRAAQRKDYLDPEAVAAYEKRYREAMGMAEDEPTYIIDQVSSETRTFGSKKK